MVKSLVFVMDGSDGSYAVHKLPNGLIDVCLIYGVDEKTSGSLLRVLDSPGEVSMLVCFNRKLFY